MRKIVFIIISALILSLYGCVISDITETKENYDDKTVYTTPEMSDDVRIIDDSETENTNELIIIDTETETEPETLAPVTTEPETMVPETTAAPETTKAPETKEITTAGVTTSPQKEGIVITHLTSPVSRNENSSLSIKGKPNTEYSIKVYYSTTASKANGLEKKISDNNGIVTWNWKVGGKTNPGNFKIEISGGGEKVETRFTVN